MPLRLPGNQINGLPSGRPLSHLVGGTAPWRGEVGAVRRRTRVGKL